MTAMTVTLEITVERISGKFASKDDCDSRPGILRNGALRFLPAMTEPYWSAIPSCVR